MKSFKCSLATFIGLFMLMSSLWTLAAQELSASKLMELKQFTAGRCAIEYIEAFNAKGDDALRRFYTEYKSPEALKQRPVETRLLGIGKARQMLGKLRMATFKVNSDLDVEIIAKTTAADMWFSVRVQMEENQPNINASIRLGPSQPPSDSLMEIDKEKSGEKPRKKDAKPQTPMRPFPYDEESVTYKTKNGTVSLAGILTLPRSEEPHPAVYLIPGASPFDRDQTLGGHKSFLVWADFLTRKGVAVLRMDDRGVNESTGSKLSTGYDDLIDDVLAGIDFLKNHDKIDPARIGVMGHSQGGILAPLVAARSSDISFVVMLAGAGMPFADNLAFQQASQGNGTIEVNLELTRQLIDVLKKEKDPEIAKSTLQRQWDAYSARLPVKEKAASEAFMKEIQNPLQIFLSNRMMRDLLFYDTADALRQLTSPVLAVAGDHDAMDINLPAIAKALEEGGNPGYHIMKIPKLNHFFQLSEKEDEGDPTVWAGIDETVNPEVLELVSEWIALHTRKQ